MMASTYTPIATTTLASDTASYTFSSIPSTYTDLILIVNGKIATGGNALGLDYRINSDTGTNYSKTQLLYNAGSVSSSRDTSASRLNVGIITQDYQSLSILHLMNYANGNIYKSFLSQAGAAGGDMRICVGLWRSNSAINSIQAYQVNGHNLSTGTSLTLYGIQAA